jgi:peptide/nickel transport system substrate-binding protein
VLGFIGHGMAATPADTLIVAAAIDEMSTLDPAEINEFSGAEYAANTYDRLVGFNMQNTRQLQGVIAESWDISEDKMTYVFTIRKQLAFASGNPLTAEDVAFSLQRVVLLNKSLAYILTQFGFTPKNVSQRIKAVGDRLVKVRINKPYAPEFFIYCLTSTLGSVVDKKLVLEHETNGDLGYAWLKNHYAGSGPFTLKQWKPAEILVLERNETYWGSKAKPREVIIRQISDSSLQRILLEKGDIDIARNLQPNDIEAVSKNNSIQLVQQLKNSIYYLGMNQKNKYLRIPQVRCALRYLIHYDDMANSFLKGRATVRQSFLPGGFLGALDDKPFRFNLARARSLLDEVGLSAGFQVNLNVRLTEPVLSMATAIQSSLARANIRVKIVTGDGQQALKVYRSRNHDLHIGIWGSDYMDPHTNASAFASNPDNSDNASSKTLAWRNSWEIPAMTAMTEATLLESDLKKREKMYQEIQQLHQFHSPFVILFQQIEVLAKRSPVNHVVLGPNFDNTFYQFVSK